MIKMINENERLLADGNTHRIIEEEGQESSDFSLLCIGSRLRKIKWGKTSRRVSRNDLDKVTANERSIS